VRIVLGKETHHGEVIAKDANATLCRAGALGNLLSRGLPVSDGSENVKINGGLHGGRLLVGEKGLEESRRVGHACGGRRRSRWSCLGLSYNIGCNGLAHRESSYGNRVMGSPRELVRLWFSTFHHKDTKTPGKRPSLAVMKLYDQALSECRLEEPQGRPSGINLLLNFR